ncbi:hypothetical protein HMPREF3038_03128 [Akkermansia sp. KLE1797]|nr:hypothetical protein HMPREF3038_03128 [Akkermansia sp. KLE1797]KXU52560.1 hypothetical protein HMPREF3039_03338 [Akkermansia sp. KLE1798]KZA03282.1 hypothetical protein HMPREF1326_03001 [Akkermansia sp. KLE1605]
MDSPLLVLKVGEVRAMRMNLVGEGGVGPPGEEELMQASP